jgi:type IV pilus assembly protein PilB
MGARKALGELLLKENLIDLNQLEQARRDQKTNGGRLTSALVRLGYIKESALADFIGKQYSLPTIDLANFEIDPEAIKMVPRAVCVKNMVIPVSVAGKSLVVAFSDPSNIYVKDDLSLLTRHKIEVVVASEPAIQAAIEKNYGTGAASGNSIDNLLSQMEDDDSVTAEAVTTSDAIDEEREIDEGPIVKFVNAMLAEAIRIRASDIHIEPYEKRFRIRFRVDGSLLEKTNPPSGAASAIVSRLKILSKMDISERRKPQDGRMKVRMKNGREVDFRVNSVPTLWGEKVVMRLLDKSGLQVDLTKLGMEQNQLDDFKEALFRPQGMILVTGPTGSGKTTTIYSALGDLNKADTNISTAEDPVEFNLDGINQIQVNSTIGFTFADALRAFLRQDPEVIMVGEIRDLETAEVAYKAASTGHLVVSTLHTNDSASTVSRLLEIGVAPYIVSEATTLVVAQRLIRKNCLKCVNQHKVLDATLIELGVAPDQLHEYKNTMKGEGCSECNNAGLKGRMAVFEVLKMSVGIKDVLYKSASPLAIKRAAIEQGMQTLRQSALLKLKAGLTTIEEVLGNTVGDDV